MFLEKLDILFLIDLLLRIEKDLFDEKLDNFWFLGNKLDWRLGKLRFFDENILFWFICGFLLSMFWFFIVIFINFDLFDVDDIRLYGL